MALVLDGNEIGADINGHCISNLRFADDISLIAGRTDDLQQLVNKVYTTSDKFGLRVSSTKTEVQCVGRERQQMKIVLGNNELVQCEDLGGVISQDSTCDKDVARRIEFAADVVRNLGKVWKAKDISKATKVLL